MGNQLSGIAPSQILSVEHYFSDLPDIEFDGRWDYLCRSYSERWNFRLLIVLETFAPVSYIIIYNTNPSPNPQGFAYYRVARFLETQRKLY